MSGAKRLFGRMAGVLLSGILASVGLPAANAQLGASAPPAVGVMEAVKRPITESNEFLGRIEATSRVNVVARVTAFLDKRNFVEGAEVKTGDLLYQLQRGPFEVDLKSKQADARTFANMEVALERACERFGPQREDHETRRYIASKILECAQGGDRTLTGLTEAGLVAATELSFTHGA